MKKNPIPKIAFIGVGKQGKEHLAAFIQLMREGDVEVVAQCDMVPTGLSSDIPIFVDYQYMMTKVKPDIVCIATPNFMHKDMCLFALSQGAYVMKEKPLATNLIDGEQMIAAARSAQKEIYTTQQRYYSPLFLQVKKVLPMLGKIQSFSYQITLDDVLPSWYWHAGAGGGCWLNLGWHAVAMIEWLLGPVSQVELTTNSGGKRTWQYSTDHTAYAKLHIGSGVTGTVLVSSIYPKKEVLKIYGSSGFLVVNRQQVQLVTDREVHTYTLPIDAPNPYVQQAWDVLHLYKTKRSTMTRDLHILQTIQRGFDFQKERKA